MEEILNLEMALKNPPPEADSNELEKKVNKWVRIIATKIEQKRTHSLLRDVFPVRRHCRWIFS